MSTPAYKRLTDEEKRARLTSIREFVRPILETNNIPFFTDHSVKHSDCLCNIIDELTAPLETSGTQLNNREAFILYAACYLHDIGMQHQNAGDTYTIKNILAEPPYHGQSWEDLSIETKRLLTRKYHHLISREMVRSSVNESDPILGIQLSQYDEPGYIASLCESHGIDTESQKYKELVQEGPGLEMPLLAALLRLADLLDESQRRALRYLQNTRELDLTARVHWWRHHFVADITFVPADRRIDIWFDFPPDRREEYNKLIPELQIPYLQKELDRQQRVMGKANLLWRLNPIETPSQSSVAEPMPDEVQMEIVAELTKRKNKELEIERHASLGQLKESRPLIRRAFARLRGQEENEISPDEYLRKAATLAKQLWEIGGRRDAWLLLKEEHKKMKNRANPEAVLETGFDLCRMMLDDNVSEQALQEISDLQNIIVNTLEGGDEKEILFFELFVEALIEQYDIKQAIEYIEELIEMLPGSEKKRVWTAKYAEILMLVGKLTAAEEIAGSERGQE